MVQWTGGVLRSNMHRVNYAPGDQAKVPRYSVGLLVRPQTDVKMGRLLGEKALLAYEDGVEEMEEADQMKAVTAAEWEKKENL